MTHEHSASPDPDRSGAPPDRRLQDAAPHGGKNRRKNRRPESIHTTWESRNHGERERGRAEAQEASITGATQRRIRCPAKHTGAAALEHGSTGAAHRRGDPHNGPLERWNKAPTQPGSIKATMRWTG